MTTTNLRYPSNAASMLTLLLSQGAGVLVNITGNVQLTACKLDIHITLSTYQRHTYTACICTKCLLFRV